MLTGTRVRKHLDHRGVTRFRLFWNGELINCISVDDIIADELERLLTTIAGDGADLCDCKEFIQHRHSPRLCAACERPRA